MEGNPTLWLALETKGQAESLCWTELSSLYSLMLLLDGRLQKGTVGHPRWVEMEQSTQRTVWEIRL